MKVRFAVAPAGGLLTEAELTGFADALERSDFDGVWLSDLPARAVVDPLLGLAALAGRTRRLKLGANIVPLGRNPFLLAKSLAALDRISGGRLLLSFVSGLAEPGEREALGWGGTSRGAAVEDALPAVRGWWSGHPPGDATAGAGDLGSVARPLQDPLEVWLGGRGPKALERAGRLADGWLGALVDPAEARAARLAIEQAAERAGRTLDPEHFGVSLAYARDPPTADTLMLLRARRPQADPLELMPVGAGALRAMIGGYLEAGLSKFVLRPAMGPIEWPDEVEWLTTAVLDMQS